MPQTNLREQLLDSALEVFHTQGYNGSSVDDIVRAAGVPKGSFYNHFESKEALGAEVARRYAGSVRCDMLSTPGKSPVARIRLHLEYLVERNAAWGVERGCVLGNFATELANQSVVITEAVRESYDVWTKQLAVVIKEARAAGELPKKTNPIALASYLIDSLQGATARAKIVGTRAPLDEFLSITLATVLR
jgi:TetR/AcrR family transcriptional repressor of nem operon